MSERWQGRTVCAQRLASALAGLFMMDLSGALNFGFPSGMFYGEQLVISLIYLKTCRVKKQGEEKKARASEGFPHFLGFCMFMSKLKSNINYRHLEKAIIICHSR